MDTGRFGLNDIVVNIVITRKYTFAALLNWYKSERGAHVNSVYFVVRTLFERHYYEQSFSGPNFMGSGDLPLDGPPLGLGASKLSVGWLDSCIYELFAALFWSIISGCIIYAAGFST